LSLIVLEAVRIRSLYPLDLPIGFKTTVGYTNYKIAY
jgi:hypothetical protein